MDQNTQHTPAHFSALDTIRKTNEAYCVRLGLPIKRQFTDEDLKEAFEHVDRAREQLGREFTTAEAI